MIKLFNSIKSILSLIIKGFSEHSLLTYAASIAFYTIFSLPGLLIIVIITAGLFLSEGAAQSELIDQLSKFIGSSSANSVKYIIESIHLKGDISFKTGLGIGTVIFSATTIFISLQEALNRIWDVVATPKRGFIKFLKNRILSFGMIISLGLILLISLLLDTLLTGFFGKVENSIGEPKSIILGLSSLFSTIIILFTVIILVFKVLPDVKLKWKDAFLAAGITTVLLMVGNFLIGYYIQTSDFTATYEAAGSIIIILVWVYYSTFVVLLGAEIMRAIMIHNHRPIQPADGAMKVNVQQLKYEDYISSTYEQE
ncbi:MAG: YihY/virulence factor BrkB family protein [Crocinitomicaceae bacterium]